MGYIRDLQGIKNKQGRAIKPNCLLRSAQLDKPSKKQIEYLNNIKLRKIIDLRNEDEAKTDVDITIAGCQYLIFPYVETDFNGAVHGEVREQISILSEMPTMKQTYESFFDDEYSLKNVKKSLREIVLNDEFPVLFHCATGKDRAGVLSALLLSLLDVDYETVVDDYMKQKKLYVFTSLKLGFLVFILTFSYSLAKKVFDYYYLKRDFLDASFDMIKKNFSSVENFFKEYVELSDEDIQKFRDRVLLPID